MVFNAPTSLNYTNADLYSFERRKIQQFNYNALHNLNILSHTYFEISYNSDLTDNIELPWHRKIKFVVRARKKFCSQASCQSFFPRGNKCGLDDEPRVFKSGDYDIEACQFSCFNLFQKTLLPDDEDDDDKKNKNDKKKKEKKTNPKEEQYARAPFLMYSYRQCACTMHDNSIFALGIDDYVRTDKHPLPRVDTIGTGFHYSDSGNAFDHKDFKPEDNPPFVDIEGNESFRFNVNRYYCDDFHLKFDGSRCYQSLGEKIFGFLVSSTLYKACQYGIRYSATGVSNTDVQKLDLPPVRENPQHQTFDSWKNDIDENVFFINPNVSLLDLGFTENMKHCIFTTEYGYPGKLVEPLASGLNMTGNLIDYNVRNKDRLHQFKYDIYTGRRLIDEYEIYGIYKYIRSNPTKKEYESSDYNNPHDELVNIFKGLSENLGEVGAMLALSYMFDKGLKYSQNILKLSAEFLENTITPTLLHIVTREFLSQTLNPALRIFSQIIAKLIRTSASLIKMVDVATTILGIIDLFDIGFDFFNMNKIMDNGTIQQYSELDIAGIRQVYGYGTVEFSPVTFMLMCEQLKLRKKWKNIPNSASKLKCAKDFVNHKYMIPITEVIDYNEDNTNAYEWVSEYIFSLKVNSNGLKINWEDENKLPSDVIDQYLKINENIYLKGMDEYSKYTESFRKRVNLSKYAIIILIVLFLVVLFFYANIATPFLFIAAITACYMVFSNFKL